MINLSEMAAVLSLDASLVFLFGTALNLVCTVPYLSGRCTESTLKFDQISRRILAILEYYLLFNKWV